MEKKLNFTDQALNQINIITDNQDKKFFRITVQGGGCSGFKYNFGFDTKTNVILIAATHRPDVLDKALLRPGRFDRQVVVDVPDVNGREQILKIHTRKIPLSKNVKLNIIAKGTPGMVGADLENLVNESALLAARKNKKKV